MLLGKVGNFVGIKKRVGGGGEGPSMRVPKIKLKLMLGVWRELGGA